MRQIKFLLYNNSIYLIFYLIKYYYIKIKKNYKYLFLKLHSNILVFSNNNNQIINFHKR